MDPVFLGLNIYHGTRVKMDENNHIKVVGNKVGYEQTLNRWSVSLKDLF